MNERFVGVLQTRRDETVGVLFLVFYAVGVLGHYLEPTLPLMLTITPYFLLVFGVGALAPVLREAGFPVLLWAAGTYVLTFAAEALGVATGAVFGSYEYGNTLGPTALGVPLVIGFNWVLVVLGAVRVCSGLNRSVRAAALAAGLRRFPAGVVGAIAAGTAAALLGVVFDLILEPVAMRFDYWSWEGDAVPLKNYAAWFVVGLIPAVTFFASGMSTKTRIPAYYLAVQALFFTALLPAAL